MLLPNQCSFCAHQRTHTHKSPYCCPECGALCRSAYFQTHVKENCLHYARKVGYRWVPRARRPGRGLQGPGPQPAQAEHVGGYVAGHVHLLESKREKHKKLKKKKN